VVDVSDGPTRYLPSSVWALWPDEDEGPFRLRLYWGIVDDRVECVGIELTSVHNPDVEEPFRLSPPEWDPTPEAITSSLLRRLNISGIVEQTKAGIADFLEHEMTTRPDRFPDSADLEEQVAQLRRLRNQAAPRRRRGYGPDHYAAVAGVYQRAYQRHEPPTLAVAEEWVVSKSTAAKWVASARRLGLLGPTQRGKAGGIRPKKGDGNDES
jgi:hypothetical protein